MKRNKAIKRIVSVLLVIILLFGSIPNNLTLVNATTYEDMRQRYIEILEEIDTNGLAESQRASLYAELVKTSNNLFYNDGTISKSTGYCLDSKCFAYQVWGIGNNNGHYTEETYETMLNNSLDTSVGTGGLGYYNLHDTLSVDKYWSNTSFCVNSTGTHNSVINHSRTYNSTRLSIDRIIKATSGYGKTSGHTTLSLVATSDDNGRAGGSSIISDATTGNSAQVYWCYTELNDLGQRMTMATWQEPNAEIIPGKVEISTDTNRINSLDCTNPYEKDDRTQSTQGIIQFRWWTGNNTIGSGRQLISGPELVNKYERFYLCYKPFTYTFKDAGVTKATVNRTGIVNIISDGFDINAVESNLTPRTGYHFKGWKVTSGGGYSEDNKQYGMIFTSDELETMMSDGKFYSSLFADAVFEAVWEANNYTVVIHPSNSNDTLADLKDSNLTYYVDDMKDCGWNFNSTNGTFSKEFTYDEDFEIENPDEFFNAKGFDFGYNTDYVDEDGNFVMSAYDLATHNLTTVNGGEVHIYAQPQPKTFNFTFDANGGTINTSLGSKDNKLYEIYKRNYYYLTSSGSKSLFNTTLPQTKTTANKTGYRFSYWSYGGTQITDSAGNFILANDYDILKESNGVLTAVFAPITYKVKIHTNSPVANTNVTQSSTSTSGGFVWNSSEKCYEATLTYDKTETIYDLSNRMTITGYKTTSGLWTDATNGTDILEGSSSKSKVWNLSSTQDTVVNLYIHWEDDNANYTVKHLFEDANGNYIEDTTKRQVISARIGSTVTPTPLSDSKYITPSSKSVVVKADGSAVVEYRYERKSYTVTITKGTGISTVTGGGTYKWGKAVGISATASAGYSFGSWTGYNGLGSTTSSSTSFTMPTQNVSLTANAGATSYKITYILNGGAVSGNPSTYTTTTAVTLKNPTKTGYTFLGWTCSELNITSPKITAIIPVGTTGDLTFEAHWDAKSVNYKVNHYLMTLDGVYPDTADYTDTKSALADSSVTLSNLKNTYTGFTYAHGKVGGSTVTTTSIKADGSTVINLYYSRNKYTLTLNKGKGIGSVSGAGTYYYGQTVDIDAVVNDGYLWSNWTGTQTITDKSSTITMGTSNITLTANGEPRDYSIQYVLDGGVVNGTNPTTYNIETPTFTLINPTKTGYNFKGWCGGKLVAGAMPALGTTVKVEIGTTGDLLFAATWTARTDIKYKVNHYLMDTNGVSYTLKDTKEYNNGTADSYISISDLKQNYNGFTYKEGKVNNAVVTSAKVEPDGSLVIDLYYTRNKYKLTLNCGDGIKAVSGAGDYYHGSSITIDAIVKDKDVQYTYGWKDWTGTYTSTDKAYTFTMPIGNVDLTANGTKTLNKYRQIVNVKYEQADGSFTEETAIDKDYTYGDTVSWSRVADKIYKEASLTPYTVTGTKTSTVIVYRQTYTLTIEKDKGIDSVTGDKTYRAEEQVTVNATVKPGYSFNGWSGNLTSDDNRFSFVMPCKTTTIKANTTANIYTIDYILNGGKEVIDNPDYYTVEDTFTLNNPTRDGYDFIGWTCDNLNITTPRETMTVGSGTYGNLVFEAHWKARNDTPYRVEHYLQKLSKDASNLDNYELVLKEDFKGVTDTLVTPSVKVYEGFKAPNTQTVNVNGDGSTVVRYYYTRQYYTLTVTNGKGTEVIEHIGSITDTNSTDNTRNYMFGETVTLSTDTLTGYENFNWQGYITDINKTISFIMPSKNIEVSSNATPKTLTVTFNRNKDSSDTNTATQKFTYDEANQKITDKGWGNDKTGYTLIGWSYNRNSKTVDIPLYFDVTNEWINKYSPNIELYGVWTPNDYKITFDKNKPDNATGTVTITGDTNHYYTYDERIGYLPSASLKGWEFKGWSTDKTGESIITIDTKYSLQGTTQGRYLTGGVPPVRFSM